MLRLNLISKQYIKQMPAKVRKTKLSVAFASSKFLKELFLPRPPLAFAHLSEARAILKDHSDKL